MTPAHLHLLLNHLPTVGSAAALGLLLLALVRRDEALKHAGLEVLFVIAVVTLPAYASGVAAHRDLRDRPQLSDNAMRVDQARNLIPLAIGTPQARCAYTTRCPTHVMSLSICGAGATHP